MERDMLAARLYEAVADDERLRGGLTDHGYGAILEWAARRADHLAAHAGEVDLETLAGTLRTAVHSLVLAAQTDSPTELTGIDPLVASPAAVAAIAAALIAAPEEPDARARAMASAPIEGLGT